MPEYFVRIALSGKSPSDIRKQLRAAFGASVAKQSRIDLSGILPDFFAACQANDHFGCVHWTDEDLVTRLRELKIHVTPEMIDSIKSSRTIRHIPDRMIEHGWEAIEQAITEAQTE
jgi:hypothetical protein